MSDLNDLLLEKIGYQEKPNPCKRCVHFSEKDDPVLDRAWIQQCDLLAPVIVLTVHNDETDRQMNQHALYTWATDVFGDIARQPRERGLRFLEEAIEVAQSIGLAPVCPKCDPCTCPKTATPPADHQA